MAMVLHKEGPGISVSSNVSEVSRDPRPEFQSMLNRNNADTFLKDCDLCGRKFRSKEGYRRHRQMFHSDRRFPECILCGKNFASLHNLKIHYASHTNLRPYKCDVCQNTYKLKHHLKDHRCSGRSKATSENPTGSGSEDYWYYIS